MAISTNNKKIKNLLKKGALTGLELSKIVIETLWEAESKVAQPIPGREPTEKYDPFMESEELNSLLDKNLADQPRKQEEYNNWRTAFPLMVYARDKALILYLETANILSATELILERFLTEAIVRHDMKWIPEIVTEKQYQDLKAKQRKELLKEKSSLDWILLNRNSEFIVSDHGEWIMDLLEGSEEQKDAVKYFKKASSEIHKYIKEGKLSVTYQKNTLSLLERIQTKPEDEILAIIDSCISAEPERKMKEPEPYLEKSKATGEALYNTGWPEWVKWIDKYKHNFDKNPPYEVAIIQNPTSSQIDKRGYYVNPDSIADHPFIKMQDNPLWEKIKLTPRLFFSIQLQNAKHHIRDFLFYRSVLKSVSGALGLNLTKELNEWHKHLKNRWDSLEEGFDRVLVLSQKAKDIFSDMAEIEIADLQPSQEVVQYIEKRVREPLGTKQWFYDCQMAFYKDKMKNTDTPDSEEGRQDE